MLEANKKYNGLGKIIDAADLQRYLDAHQGFLASRRAGRGFYTVHDLSAFCHMPIDLTSGNDSVYFAEDTGAFTQAWSATGWIECGSCLHQRLRQ